MLDSTASGIGFVVRHADTLRALRNRPWVAHRTALLEVRAGVRPVTSDVE
jgi:hypothetical protein